MLARAADTEPFVLVGRDLIGHLETEGVAPAAETDHHQIVPGFGRFQGIGQHHHGLSRTALADLHLEVVLVGFCGDPQTLFSFLLAAP